MVIQNSDSLQTLVSLNNNDSNSNQQQQNQSGGVCRSKSLVGGNITAVANAAAGDESSWSTTSLSSSIDDGETDFVRTALYLPGGDYSYDVADDDSFYSCLSSSSSNEQHYGGAIQKDDEQQLDESTLWIPSSSCLSQSASACASNTRVPSIDEVLASIPEIVDRCDELLSVPHWRFTSRSRERLLYVSQGEVAHATPQQCDILVSDKATTCHILALKSYTSRDAASQTISENQSTQAPQSPCSLSSMAHIDSTRYDECVRDMVQRHVQYHSNSTHEETIRLEIHTMGGFQDDRNTSRSISEWLLRLLADLAEEYRNVMKFTLQTCAITSLNDDGRRQRPIGRGLALRVNLPPVTDDGNRGGDCFLASCDRDVAGPCVALRMARVFSRHVSTLHCIHNETSPASLIIPPFRYDEHVDTDMLLSLPDEYLLRCCSTSPFCEEDHFCHNMRITLQFLRGVPYYSVFGKQLQYTLEFQRVENSTSPNTWQAAIIEPKQQQQQHSKVECALSLKFNTTSFCRRNEIHPDHHNHQRDMKLVRRIQHM